MANTGQNTIVTAVKLYKCTW